MDTPFYYHGKMTDENREDYEQQLLQYKEMQREEQLKEMQLLDIDNEVSNQ